MRNTTVIRWVVLGSLLTVPFHSVAEPSEGASVLEREALRARELQDLKYQAKLIEQRARIAKAYQEFKESGGYIPGDMDSMDTIEAQKPQDTQHLSLNKKPENAPGTNLPTLKQINGRKASFLTDVGYVEAKAGGHLPGGYRVLTVSSVEGVKLEKEGVVYQVGFNWK